MVLFGLLVSNILRLSPWLARWLFGDKQAKGHPAPAVAEGYIQEF